MLKKLNKMKKTIVLLAFMLIGNFAFASDGVKKTSTFDDSVNLFYEYKIIINKEGLNTCYVRVCWNISETRRECTDWQEVPCNTDLELESKSEEK